MFMATEPRVSFLSLGSSLSLRRGLSCIVRSQSYAVAKAGIIQRQRPHVHPRRPHIVRLTVFLVHQEIYLASASLPSKNYRPGTEK